MEGEAILGSHMCHEILFWLDIRAPSWELGPSVRDLVCSEYAMQYGGRLSLEPSLEIASHSVLNYLSSVENANSIIAG